jgi:hypothetical protein
MRLTMYVACALILFVVSFSALYIFCRAEDPHIRGLVGAAAFSLAPLLLLWKDAARSGSTKRAL